MDQELLSIILLIVLMFVILVLIAITNNQALNKKVKEKIEQELEQLSKLLESKNPLVYRDILIRLDSLLAKSLQARMKNTDSCGDNLKKAKDFFDKETYDKIWKVHKLRNEVVHENRELEYSEVKNGYNVMKKAIKKIL